MAKRPNRVQSNSMDDFTRLAMSLAGLPIRPMFFIKNCMAKPYKKYLRALLTTFSKQLN